MRQIKQGLIQLLSSFHWVKLISAIIILLGAGPLVYAGSETTADDETAQISGIPGFNLNIVPVSPKNLKLNNTPDSALRFNLNLDKQESGITNINIGSVDSVPFNFNIEPLTATEGNLVAGLSEFGEVSPDAESTTPVNVALYKRATAHFQTPYPVYAAQLAVDNRLSTYWLSYIQGVPHWLEVDLGQNYNLKCAHVYSAGNVVNTGTVSDFELQTWTGSQWEAIPGGVVTGNTDIGLSIVFPDIVTANKVRLYSTGNAYLVIRELALYTGSCPEIRDLNPADEPAPNVLLVSGYDGFSGGTMYVRWSNITSALRYSLEIKLNDENWQVLSDYLPTNGVLIGTTVNGDYQYRVRACNQTQCGGYAYSATYTVIINQPPVAADSSVEINQISTMIDLSSFVTDDGDINWDSLVFTQPQRGTVTRSDSSPIVTLNYPAESFTSIESFSFHVSDAEGLASNEANVSLVVNLNVNEPPLAGNLNLSVSQNIAPTVIDLSSQISDDGLVDWSSLTFSQPAHGRVSLAAGAPGLLSVDYAGVSYSGVDTINYSIKDIEGLQSNIGVITINVNVAVNLAPTANNLDFNINNDNPLISVDLTQHVQDDNGIAWGTLTFSSLTSGSVRVDPARSNVLIIDYSTADFIGSETIQYSVYDNQGLQSNIATLSLNVNVDHNVPPVSQSISRTINHDSRQISLDLSQFVSDDGDINWQSLSFSQPAHGQVSVNNSTILTIDYSGANYSGSDSFQYRVNDSQGLQSNNATVALTVNALQNTAPVAADSRIIISEDNLTVTLDLATIVSDDFGIDWATLEISSLLYGKLNRDTGSSVLSFDYRNTSFSGQEQLNYWVKDSHGLQSNSGLILIDVDVSTVPLAPDNIAVSSVSNSDDVLGLVTISWDPVVDTRYDIQHQFGSDNWQNLALNISINQINASQLFNGVHRFRVRACRIAVELCSNYKVSPDHVIALPPAKVPDINRPLIDDSGMVTLSWQSAPNAQFYQVAQQADGQQTWTDINLNIAATHLDFAVNSNNQYIFRVIACNSIGCSEPVESAPAIVALSPMPPAIFSAVTGAEQFQLSWSEVATATQYHIRQQKTDGSWLLIEDSLSQPRYSRAKLSGFIPEFQLTACNSFGCSTTIETTAVDATGRAIVNYFYSDAQVLSLAGQPVQLHWQVDGAINIKITDQLGNSYDNLSAQSSLTLQPDASTEYTLNATDAQSGVQTQSLRVVVTADSDNSWQSPADDARITPVASSTMIDSSGNRYFGDLQGNLHKRAVDGSSIWQIPAVGLISGPPVMDGNQLYFSSNSQDGTGRLCRVQTDGSNLNCAGLGNPVVASPVLYGNSILAMDLNGVLYQADTNLTLTELYRHPSAINVRSTPVLAGNSLFVRTTSSEIIRIDLNTGDGQGLTRWIKEL